MCYCHIFISLIPFTKKGVQLSLLIFFTSFSGLFAQTFPHNNIQFLANIDPEPTVCWYGNNTRYAGCSGWYNVTDKKEYAIIGGTTGNYFVDVSIPDQPVLVDYVAGAAQNSLWREIATYKNYAYLVSDDNVSKLQVVDLSYLPDSVHLVYESDAIFSRAHTVFVNNDKLYCGGVTTTTFNKYSLCVLDLSKPHNPTLLRTLNQDYPSFNYVHDMHVRNDTVYASCGTDGLHVFTYNYNNTFSLIASYTNYIQAGYNHSSSLSNDGKTLVFTDEIPPNTVVKILDVSNLNNLSITDTIRSNFGATSHNPYVIGQNAVLSYYQDGIVVLDIGDPYKTHVTGYFDTNPDHGLNDNYSNHFVYQGCWGAYPYLPSGILLASDMQRGLFVLDPKNAYKNTVPTIENNIQLFPNPVVNELFIYLSSETTQTASLQIFDVQGKLVLQQKLNLHVSLNKINWPLNALSAGTYALQISGESLHFTQKIAIIH